MNARGALHAGDRTPLLDPRAGAGVTSSAVGASVTPTPPAAMRARESTRVDLRRLGAIGLVLFCLATAVGLVRVIAVSNQVLAALQQLPAVRHSAAVAAGDHSHSPWSAAGANGSDAQTARVLVVYSNGTHLSKLAEAVKRGVHSVLANDTASLRVRTVATANFTEDVLWADAVILGSHVVNANVEPKMSAFMSSWSLSADLSRKVGAVFVTGGGISAGEELTMVNLLHSMLIFRMVVVGGERWTSAFGASAVVSEGPFQPLDQAQRGDSDDDGARFPSICYQTDPDAVHSLFKDKAVGLGRRVASLAVILRQHTP